MRSQNILKFSRTKQKPTNIGRHHLWATGRTGTNTVLHELYTCHYYHVYMHMYVLYLAHMYMYMYMYMYTHTRTVSSSPVHRVSTKCGWQKVTSSHTPLIQSLARFVREWAWSDWRTSGLDSIIICCWINWSTDNNRHLANILGTVNTVVQIQWI